MINATIHTHTLINNAIRAHMSFRSQNPSVAINSIEQLQLASNTIYAHTYNLQPIVCALWAKIHNTIKNATY